MAAMLYKLSLQVTKNNLKIYSVSTSSQVLFFCFSGKSKSEDKSEARSWESLWWAIISTKMMEPHPTHKHRNKPELEVQINSSISFP